MDAAIKTLARQYNWTPFEIRKLYVDNYDDLGLFYWYQDCKDYIDEINSKNKAG